MKEIVLSDYSWMYHKSYYVQGDLQYVSDEKIWKTGGMFGCLSTINYLRKRYECPIIIATEPEINFRKKLDETYKGGRSKKDPEMYDLWHETLSALSLIKNVFIISSEEEGEADDVVYSFIRSNKNSFDKFFIHGTDNDYLQIASIPELRNKVYYTPRSSKIQEDILLKDYCQKKYEVDIEKILIYRSLLGDTSDNIPSIAPGMRKKYLRIWVGKDGVKDPQSLIAEVWTERDNKTAELVIHNQKALERNFELTRLRDLKTSKAIVDNKPLDHFVDNYGMQSLKEIVAGSYGITE